MGYDDILFNEYGESVHLSADEFIDFLIESLYQCHSEKMALERQLSRIRLVLDPDLEVEVSVKKINFTFI